MQNISCYVLKMYYVHTIEHNIRIYVCTIYLRSMNTFNDKRF